IRQRLPADRSTGRANSVGEPSQVVGWRVGGNAEGECIAGPASTDRDPRRLGIVHSLRAEEVGGRLDDRVEPLSTVSPTSRLLATARERLDCTGRQFALGDEAAGWAVGEAAPVPG